MSDADHWPTELRIGEGGRVLRIAFADGSRFALPAEYLRVMSPSAEVQGHSRKERKTVAGKSEVAIVGADPIGTYAVKLIFDDRHETGIYTWSYLHDLGITQADKWAAYLLELENKGLNRHQG